MQDIEVFVDKHAIRQYSRRQRAAGKTVAFVPTMGFLHDGHLSLVKLAKELADVVIVSIYVNPAQFAAHEDFSVYPQDSAGDLLQLRNLSVDAVFTPSSLYDMPAGSDNALVVGATQLPAAMHQTYVVVEQLQQGLCGRSRPHFFRGVATVVCKLFHIVEPDVAVFGRKDFQQLRVIQRMVHDLDLDIRVIGGTISREPDGLAMSSRNAMLTEDERRRAACIRQALLKAQDALGSMAPAEPCPPGTVLGIIREDITAAGGIVDYVEAVSSETLQGVEDMRAQPAVIAVAAWFGKVRLIDNIAIPEEL